MTDRRAHSHVLERALRDERGRAFFYEGPSPWREGKTNRPGKSMEEARNDNRNLVNLLERAAEHTQHDRLEIERLARRLRQCTAIAPCLRGACRICGLAGQRLLEQAGTRYRREASEPWSLATFIESRYVVACGDLASVTPFESIVPAIRAALGNVRAFGGLEICVNESTLDQSFYAEHGHLYLPRPVALAVSRRLRLRLPATPEVPKPRLCKHFDLSRKGSAYPFKADGRRRIELEPEMKGEGRMCRRHRWKDMLSAERVEVALAQDASGLGSHVFLHGLTLAPRGSSIILRPTSNRHFA